MIHRDRGITLRLVENLQLFKNGLSKMPVLEKTAAGNLRIGENATAVVRSAVSKILGIADTELLEVVPGSTIMRGPYPTRLYPGLNTMRFISTFTVELPRELYRSEGYVVEDPDKSTYFVWRRCEMERRRSR